MEEIWKDVIDYPYYQISSFGRVRSLDRIVIYSNGHNVFYKGTTLKQYVDKQGYSHASIYNINGKNTFRVHYLVAIYFLPNKRFGRELVVNHIDFNKSNNNITNLEVVSARENSNLKHIPHSSIYTGVSFCKNMGKYRSVIAIKKKNKHLGYFINEYDAHLAYEAELTNINKNI